MRHERAPGLAWCFAGLLAWSAGAAEVPLSAAFGPGEQTTYTVRFLGLTAGEAQVTVGWRTERFGRTVWPLVCVGRTTDLGSVYPLHDRFVSYWDPLTGDALGSDFLIDENRRRRIERYRFDFTQLEAITTKGLVGQPPSERRYPIEPRTTDLAGAAFRLRSTPLEVGQVHEFPIFTGIKLYRMTASVVKREPISTPLGEVDAFRVTVNGDFSGNMVTRGLMTIFYTADSRQLPVRAEAEFAIGSVVLEAVRYEPGRVATEAL